VKEMVGKEGKKEKGGDKSALDTTSQTSEYECKW
jgi:hypothetical protein